MNASTIAQKNADRKLRALQIAADDHVTRNGQPHQFNVRSQNGHGNYLAATPEIFPPAGKCGCRDHLDFARHHQILCKHVQAAIIFEKAEAYAAFLVEKHQITFSQLEDHLLADLSYGAPEPMATKLMILLHATRRLIAASEGGER